MLPSALIGTWAGTNGFRLMPGDPLAEFPATVTVTTPAGGHLGLIGYTWRHPDDGPQDGVLLVEAGEADAVAATWGDSWHQQPGTMALTGHRTADGGIALEGRYSGSWAWRIHVDVGPDGELRLGMDNVVPAGQGEPAGPYPVMVLRARRS